LSQILFPAKQTWKIVNAKDQRTMPEKMIWSSGGSEEQVIQQANWIPLDGYLIPLIILIVLIERWIAYKRNQ